MGQELKVNPSEICGVDVPVPGKVISAFSCTIYKRFEVRDVFLDSMGLFYLDSGQRVGVTPGSSKSTNTFDIGHKI
jgi:hypothetical protein